jgi:hypothetical protein
MADGNTSCTRIRGALRGRACRDGQQGMLLSIRDVTGVFDDYLALAWLGPEGLAFMKANEAELVAGRCVDLEIYRVRSANTPAGAELGGRIKSCALAPKAPSHIKHEEKLTQQEHTA